MVTKDPASQDGAQMKHLADQYDVRIGAIHAPCLLLTRKVWGTDPIGKINRSIEVAQDADVPVVVVHPPYRWQIGYQRWLIDRVARAVLRQRRGRGGGEHVPALDRGARPDAAREPGHRRAERDAGHRARHESRGGRRTRSDTDAAALRRAHPARSPVGQRRPRAGILTCLPERAYSISTASWKT